MGRHILNIENLFKSCVTGPAKSSIYTKYIVVDLRMRMPLHCLLLVFVYKIPYRRARAWPSASREQRYLAYNVGI